MTTMPRDDDDDDDAHRRSTRDVDEGATRPRDDDAEDADDDDVQRRAVMMEKTKRSVESTDDADASKRESEDATDATDDRDDDARGTPARRGATEARGAISEGTRRAKTRGIERCSSEVCIMNVMRNDFGNSLKANTGRWRA